MTKFFKVIMNIILILFIAALCAVFIPTFLGISVNVASGNIETNMNVGSVAYGVKESLSDINSGDKIVVSDSESLYIYEVTEINTDNGELTVRESESSDTSVVELRRTASKLVFVVPFIGYLFIAVQSFEGIIILGLAAALIVILFIISRVLAGGHADEDDGEAGEKDDDFGYFKELAASADRPSSLDNLATMAIPPIPDETTTPVSSDTVALDEEIEELSELVLEPADDGEKAAKTEDDVDSSLESLKNEIASIENADGVTAENTEETSDAELISEEVSGSETISAEESKTASEREASSEIVSNEAAASGTVSQETSEFSGLEGALEQALISNQVSKTPDDVVPSGNTEETEPLNGETPAEIELAIPTHTLDELLQEAYAKGEDPQVKKDPATGVTLVDYSSCL